jgi:hypothetical protein
MGERAAFVARAAKTDGWWVVSVAVVPGLEVRVRRVEQAERPMRESLARALRMEPDGFDLRVVPVLPAELTAQIAHARAAVADAEARQATAARLSRSVVRRLLDHGLTGADAAAILGVSPQRVSQLRSG